MRAPVTLSNDNHYQRTIDERIMDMLVETDLGEIRYSPHGEIMLCNIVRPEDEQAIIDLVAESRWWYCASAADTRTWWTPASGNVLLILLDNIACSAAYGW